MVELLKLDCDWLSRTKTTLETTDNRILRGASPTKSSRLFLFRLEFIEYLQRKKAKGILIINKRL